METMHIDFAGPYEASINVSPFSDHAGRQRLVVDAAVRYEEQIGDHSVRPDIPHQHELYRTTALLSRGQ